jgi:hypothetical protein
MGSDEGHWEVLVTGGEDTSLTVLAVQPSSGTVQVLSVITDHISNIRTLVAVMDPAGARPGKHSLSALLVSAGGRAQMQCYRLLIGWDEKRQEPYCQVIQVEEEMRMLLEETESTKRVMEQKMTRLSSVLKDF